MKSLLASLFFTFAGVLIVAIFSNHGLLDLRQLEKQVDRVHDEVSRVEEENKRLKTELDLLMQGSTKISERKVREVLGWVRPGEWIYLESTSTRDRF